MRPGWPNWRTDRGDTKNFERYHELVHLALADVVGDIEREPTTEELTMDTCYFCNAQVLGTDMDNHTRWHARHQLHRYDCYRYSLLEPTNYDCSCGLSAFEGL